ncbi:hypothetical protein WNY78_07045 [Psychroserpens sp. AS72]|uniref:hypothetical protein n=1 Tax=Psychroserpens sp. AS72 TaxID=3135775 RepID=UPI00317BDE87
MIFIKIKAIGILAKTNNITLPKITLLFFLKTHRNTNCISVIPFARIANKANKNPKAAMLSTFKIKNAKKIRLPIMNEAIAIFFE